uniref:Exocyst complex component 7 n=1 Tax=Acrobeloides nanus TaxID=290746 RepID=A0A914EGZ8_9BILA
MMRTIRNIMDQQNFLTNQHRQNPQKASLIKSAIKKATGRGNEKNTDLIENKDQAALITVLMLSALLILIQVETEVCANIFDDVKIQARVFKEIISTPFKSVMERCNSIIEQFDGAFGGILPLSKFLLRHAKQLQSLAENVRETQTFQKFQQNVYTRSSQLLSEFIDRLTNDNSRYVPEDGTVHHITSNTVNFLKMLARERATILQILDANSSTNRMQAQTNFSKLFAQILAALGVNLRNKSTTYTDEPLSALFMLNNLNHIRTCLFQDSHIESIISEQNDQISSFYEAEISSYTKKYLKSWQKVAAGFNLSELADEKRAIKMCYANFNKEFETILEAQKHYCIAEISLAVEIRNRIKGIVLRPFTEFTTKHSEDIYSSIDRQLKYDVESIEMMIDRLFDSST